jgi:ABC-type multidrug transport system fused ATPase/permease subunit
MILQIKNIFEILDNHQKKKLFLLILFMFISMLLEILGIASLIPLINFLLKNDFTLYKKNIFVSDLFKDFSQIEIIIIFLIFLFFFFLLKNFYQSLYYWFESKFIYKCRYNLGVKLFKVYIYQSYSYHLKNHSSKFFSNITQLTSIFGSLIASVVGIFANLILLIGFFIFLLILKPIESFFSLSILVFLSFSYYLSVKKKIFETGQKTQENEYQRAKLLQESFGGIKEVNIYNIQPKLLTNFQRISDLVSSQAFIVIFFQKLSKVWFETIIIFTFFLVLIINLLSNNNLNELLITLSIFLISAIKILPSINGILNNIQNIKFQNKFIDIIKQDIKLFKNSSFFIKNDTTKKFFFNKVIVFNKVSFCYPKSKKFIINECNLTIKKNDFVCIKGKTGSGKSTFVDLLTSLISPTKGQILVDNRNINENIYNWKKKISYVPQEPFLIDASIKENIIFFNNKKYSKYKLLDSITKAGLLTFINRLPAGVNTLIGEKGIRISGGERQRINIARALYRESEIIIFDESTNSLDNETENKLLRTISSFKGNKTIIFITHNNNLVSIFDRIFEFKNNKIKEINM